MPHPTSFPQPAPAPAAAQVAGPEEGGESELLPAAASSLPGWKPPVQGSIAGGVGGAGRREDGSGAGIGVPVSPAAEAGQRSSQHPVLVDGSLRNGSGTPEPGAGGDGGRDGGKGLLIPAGDDRSRSVLALPSGSGSANVPPDSVWNILSLAAAHRPWSRTWGPQGG